MVAVGGWSEGSTTFSNVASNPALRKAFAKNSATFVNKYGFDGFDIDWEYPNQRGGKQEDINNFVEMLKECNTELKKKGKLLSVAVGATESLASLSYKIDKVAQNVDFINLMTYDLHGTWDGVTGHHAGLYSSTSGDKLTVVSILGSEYLKLSNINFDFIEKFKENIYFFSTQPYSIG